MFWPDAFRRRWLVFVGVVSLLFGFPSWVDTTLWWQERIAVVSPAWSSFAVGFGSALILMWLLARGEAAIRRKMDISDDEPLLSGILYWYGWWKEDRRLKQQERKGRNER